MASSGTIAAPTIDIRERLGHDTVLLMGRVRHKSTMVLEAGDLTLRTIKNAVLMPDSIPATGLKGPVSLLGSVTMAGSVMNNVTAYVYRGTPAYIAALGYGTQTHIGTELEGTIISSFFMTGA